MKEKKLNVLLAITDQLRAGYKNCVIDYTKFFSKNQGAFKGEKRTYTAKENTIDDPTKRGITKVVTTVDEKIKYFIDVNKEYINALFDQERTNASGNAKANLIVDGEDWGEFTSLELLRFKSLLESADLGNIGNMIQAIPVRSDSEIWNKTNDTDYTDREVYETEMFKGIAKTTVKTPYILVDPNLKGKDYPPNYQPAVVTRDEILELGDYTKQNFSGEWSHTQRANAQRRRAILLTAITEALKEANECKIEESQLNAEKIFSFLFYGKKDND